MFMFAGSWRGTRGGQGSSSGGAAEADGGGETRTLNGGHVTRVSMEYNRRRSWRAK